MNVTDFAYSLRQPVTTPRGPGYVYSREHTRAGNEYRVIVGGTGMQRYSEDQLQPAQPMDLYRAASAWMAEGS